MADRLSAPLTEDVARKARRAKAHRAITTLPHFQPPHSDFVAREHASGRRARGDRQGQSTRRANSATPIQLLTEHEGARSSVHDRGGSSLLDTGVGHSPARVGDFLAVFVCMEVGDPAAADSDDVGALVDVWLSGLGRRVADPLHAHDEVPRRSGNKHALNIEAEVIQTEHALEPAAHRVAAMALAAQCMIARENVVNIVREPIESDRVVAPAQRVKGLTNPPTDESVEHRLNIVRRARLAAHLLARLRASEY